MDPINTLSILSSESRRGGHSVAAMCRYDFLVGLKAPTCSSLAPMCLRYAKRKPRDWSFTHAPPELSEPAITRMRFMLAVGLNVVFLMFPTEFRSHSIAT